MTSKNRAENSIDSGYAVRILRNIHAHEAFFFFRTLGQDTGKAALCLCDFLNMLDEVPVESIAFHFKRGDFN